MSHSFLHHVTGLRGMLAHKCTWIQQTTHSTWIQSARAHMLLQEVWVQILRQPKLWVYTHASCESRHMCTHMKHQTHSMIEDLLAAWAQHLLECIFLDFMFWFDLFVHLIKFSSRWVPPCVDRSFINIKTYTSTCPWSNCQGRKCQGT